jgi:hypothetical protein
MVYRPRRTIAVVAEWSRVADPDGRRQISRIDVGGIG